MRNRVHKQRKACLVLKSRGKLKSEEWSRRNLLFSFPLRTTVGLLSPLLSVDISLMSLQWNKIVVLASAPVHLMEKKLAFVSEEGIVVVALIVSKERPWASFLSPCGHEKGCEKKKICMPCAYFVWCLFCSMDTCFQIKISWNAVLWLCFFYCFCGLCSLCTSRICIINCVVWEHRTHRKQGPCWI